MRWAVTGHAMPLWVGGFRVLEWGQVRGKGGVEAGMGQGRASGAYLSSPPTRMHMHLCTCTERVRTQMYTRKHMLMLLQAPPLSLPVETPHPDLPSALFLP